VIERLYRVDQTSRCKMKTHDESKFPRCVEGNTGGLIEGSGRAHAVGVSHPVSGDGCNKSGRDDDAAY
jgi:hypothetical protein